MWIAINYIFWCVLAAFVVTSLMSIAYSLTVIAKKPPVAINNFTLQPVEVTGESEASND